MAAMLVNALELHEEAINIMISYPNSFQLTYTDAGNISKWAYTRMRFANQYNLMNGIKSDFIGPKTYASKEIADVELMDLDKLPEKWATSTNDISEFYDDIRSPAKTLWSDQPSKLLYKGIRVRILHELGELYYIALESGEQGFVFQEDFEVIHGITP